MPEQNGNLGMDVTARREATLRDFLNVVFHRKWMIVAIVLFTTTLVLLLNTMQPKVFESSSRILISRGQQSNAMTFGVQYLTWEEELSSQIEVVLSETVFTRARAIFADSVKANGLPEAMRFNPGSVRAEVIGESNVLAIRYTGLERASCRLGCGAVTEAYSQYYKLRQQPPELTDFFAQEIRDVRRELDHWRKKKNEFLNREKFFGMDEEGKFMLDIMAALELRQSEVDSDILMQKTKVQNIKRIMDMDKDEIEGNLAVSTNPQLLQSNIIVNIKHDLQSLRIKEEEMRVKYTDKHPKMNEIQEQIDELLNSLKGEVANIYKIELDTLELLQIKQASVNEEIRKAQAKINAIPDKEVELNEIEHKIRMVERNYEHLLQQQNQSVITLASSPEWDVVILSPASPPYQKKTKDYVRLALGPFLSLVVALGLAFFLESLDHSLSNVAEVEEYLGASVLTTISDIKSRN